LKYAGGSQIPAPPGLDFMNLWMGTASTMGEHPSLCLAFDGSKLPYRQMDYAAGDDTCAAGLPYSYGLNYSPAASSQKMFLEGVFFTPFSSSVILRDSCSGSGTVFHAPDDTTAGDDSLDLSVRTTHSSVSSLQEVIDLVGERYVCISEDSDNIEFWWNPQKLFAELDSPKELVPDWQAMDCNVFLVGTS